MLIFSFYISVQELTSGAILEHRNRFWRNTARQTTSLNQDLSETTKLFFTEMNFPWRILVGFISTIIFHRRRLLHSLPRSRFQGSRITLLPTNVCLPEFNIPFHRLANHIVPTYGWKVDLDRRTLSREHMQITDAVPARHKF